MVLEGSPGPRGLTQPNVGPISLFRSPKTQSLGRESTWSGFVELLMGMDAERSVASPAPLRRSRVAIGIPPSNDLFERSGRSECRLLRLLCDILLHASFRIHSARQMAWDQASTRFPLREIAIAALKNS
jgi:hypothetical protein